MDTHQRAELAKQILTNPIFSEAFVILKQAYIDRMLATDPDDIKKRDHFHKSVLILADVKSALTACIEKGKLEKMKAERKTKGKR